MKKKFTKRSAKLDVEEIHFRAQSDFCLTQGIVSIA